MLNINRNTPNLKNSKSVGQQELQNAKQNMNSSTDQHMILGAELAPNSSNMTSQGMTSASMPSLNSSTSAESEELQNVKNKVQKSGNNRGSF